MINYLKSQLIANVSQIKGIFRRISRYFVLSLLLVYPPFVPFELLGEYQNKIDDNITLEEQISIIYPTINKREPRYIQDVRLTAYSSTPDQTSGNPFVTASGIRVHDGTIAANCIPFGSKVRIPDLFGDKIFTVEDRLAARMGCGVVDVWFSSRSEALAFGSRYSTIEIL